MRVSWGYKIFFAYTAFAAGILFLAYKASQQNFDLVTENYYEQELKYQDVIDQKSNVALLSEAPKISHTVNSVSLQLPMRGVVHHHLGRFDVLVAVRAALFRHGECSAASC